MTVNKKDPVVYLVIRFGQGMMETLGRDRHAPGHTNVRSRPMTSMTSMTTMRQRVPGSQPEEAVTRARTVLT